MFTSFLTSGISIKFLSDYVSPAVDSVSLELVPERSENVESTFHCPLNSEKNEDIRDILLKNIDLYSILQGTLTKRQFQIFELRYMYGMSQANISRVLNIRKSSVKMTLNVALKKARENLKGFEKILEIQ